MASNTEGFISDRHGSGANVSDDDGRKGGGNNAAGNGSGSNAVGSTENSFEYDAPPGFTVTEEQRAEFDRARQTQMSQSPIPSQRGDDDASEGTTDGDADADDEEDGGGR